MFEVLTKWYRRYLFDEESILLLIMLILGLVLLNYVGDILAPLLVSIVLAYLMQGVANTLRDKGLANWLAVTFAFVLFMGGFLGSTLLLLPLVWRQLSSLVRELPGMLDRTRDFLNVLPIEYPTMVNTEQLNSVIDLARVEIAQFGQIVITKSLAGLPGLLTLGIYLILIPILVFFLLKDRDEIISWFVRFLPSERPLLKRIWTEMDDQMSNYVRGKVLEIIIVGGISYFCFAWLGLSYAALLGLLVGLSVIIPYIGAILVTIPVAAVGFIQWGLYESFYYVMVAYVVIQVLDGNVLVPLLFSEAVNLHPLAILLAVIFFGGIWGVPGVFFAIPLATLVKAVINAWPVPSDS
mgnify:FL=1